MKHYLMSLSDVPPISIMGEASNSIASKASDANSSKTSTDFPQQLSIFYAGAIADNVGAFIQLTYDGQAGNFGIDNTDIRFADVATLYGHSVIYGVSLNNNPTVQDLWNSTPAWGQPFLGSPTMQGPAAATRIEGAMAQAVAGLSAYTFVDQSIYGEVGVYRSALQGASVSNIGVSGTPPTDVISGVAPYWRFAYEYDWGQQSVELGTFGLQASLHNPTTIAGNSFLQSLQAGPTDRFTDIGIDTQYQYIDDDNQITLTGRAIRENQRLDASFAQTLSDNPTNRIDSANATLSYFWRRKLGASIGLFGVDGSTDVTYFGSPNGKPTSTWGNVEVDYLPWLNVKLGLQYTAYSKFNGASNNYDGNGRNASDNNMIFGYIWFAY
jgi:hypothetical protein